MSRGAVVSRAQLERMAAVAGPKSPLHDLLKAAKPERKRTPAKALPPSQGRTLKIVIPMPESLTNSGKGKSRHYWSKVKARRAFWRMLSERSRAGLFPPIPDGGFGRCSVTSVMYLGNHMDDDNAMARHKWVLDWMQNAGYLANDRYAKWAAVPTQIVGRSHEYRIELELREP